MMEIKGEQFGVSIEKRPQLVYHGKTYVQGPLLTLLSEDDEYWSETSVTFDAHWIDDIIDVLTAAKAAIKEDKL